MITMSFLSPKAVLIFLMFNMLCVYVYTLYVNLWGKCILINVSNRGASILCLMSMDPNLRAIINICLKL